MASSLTLQDLSKLRLGRETLERWIQEPELEEIIRGCYVRILVGEKKGQRVYRICVVKGVEATDGTGPLASYKFGDVETNKHLQLEYGNVTKTFKMDYVSNAEFSPEEFAEWLAQMHRTNQPILSAKDVDRKVKRIKTFVLEKRAREVAEMERANAPVATPMAPAAPAAPVPTTTAPAPAVAPSPMPTPPVPKPAAAPAPVRLKVEPIEEVTIDIGIDPPAKRPKLTHFKLEKPDLKPPEEVPAPLDALPVRNADGTIDEGQPEWTYSEYYAKCKDLTERVQANNTALQQLESECVSKETQCHSLANRLRRLEAGDDSELRKEKREKAVAALQARFAAVQGPYEEQKKELMDEIQQKDEILNQRKIRYRDLRVEHEAVYKDMDQERKDSKATTQKKEREMQNLQLKVKEINGKLAAHQAKLTEQQQAIDVQDGVIDELQSQLKEEEQQQITLQLKRRQQAEVLGELTRLCRALEQSTDELKMKYEALSSDETLLQAARLSRMVQA